MNEKEIAAIRQLEEKWERQLEKATKELAAHNKRLEEKIKHLERQLDEAIAYGQRQAEEAKELKEELKEAKTIINRAKDANPFLRPNSSRVRRLVRAACMDLEKVAGGWLLSMGSRVKRKFKSLMQIWLIFTQENWYLGDIFPETSGPTPAPASAEAAPKDAAPVPAAAVNLEVLASEWRLFPTARQAIKETLARLGLNCDLFESAAYAT